MEKRTINGFDVTSEQDALIGAVVLGQSVKGSAYAGAGKSTLLRGVEKYHINKKGLYLCFNKSLELEAKKLFTGNDVTVYTSHGLALSYLAPEDKRRVLSSIGKRLSPSKWVSLSGFPKDDFPALSDGDINGCINSITEIFYQTASEDIGNVHLINSFWRVLDRLTEAKKVTQPTKQKFINSIISASRKVALSVLDEKSDTPKTHDSYLKMAMTKPALDADDIVLDYH
jgi:hypothetical protein